jgi:hypothetical protein
MNPQDQPCKITVVRHTCRCFWKPPQGPGPAIPLGGLLLLCIAAGLLAGCGHAAVGDCAKADWYAIGQRDGRAGYPEDRWTDYQHACRGKSPAPDRETYEDGRREGLREYCTDANGFRIGRGMSDYGYVCPPDLEKTFLAGRARGMSLKGCPAEIYVYDEHIDSLEKALKAREQAIAQPDTPPARQTRLRREISELEAARREAIEALTKIERRCMVTREE